MTSEKLKQRLQESATNLRGIVGALSSISAPSLHNKCINEFSKFGAMASELVSICDLIEPREDAYKLLEQLPLITDPVTDLVEYHGIKIPFNNARLLGFQGYLSMTWAICDSITTSIAPLICTEATCKNRINPPQLLTHFIKEDKYSSYYSAYFLRENYGWAIGISYVIRNHFFHDGALWNGENFFAGRSLQDGFEISNKGLEFLAKEMLEKHGKLNKDQNRLGLAIQWPWHQDNLLKLLKVCNDEIDDALTCLVGWSVGMANLQGSYLLERDFY